MPGWTASHRPAPASLDESNGALALRRVAFSTVPEFGTAFAVRNDTGPAWTVEGAIQIGHCSLCPR